MDAIGLAEKLVKFYISKGYDKVSTSFTHALHKGTYKVFVNSVQVADISNVSKMTFKRLSENSHMSRIHIPIVNVQFLRMTLHLILSKGDSDSVQRWERVFKRLLTFYKEFPPKPCAYKATDNNNNEIIPNEVILELYKFFQHSEYVLFGLHEVELILGKEIDRDPNIAPIHMFVQDGDMVSTTHKIKHALHSSIKHHFKVSKVFDADDFMPKHVIMYYNKKPAIILYSTNECISYNEYYGIRIASIHAIVRMFICMTLTNQPHFEKYANSFECIANTLTIVHARKRGRTTKKLFQDIVENCYGVYPGIITMRKERLMRIQEED